MNLSREVLKTEREIADRVRQMGREITEHYKGQEISMLGVLKGSFVFVADLARQVKLPVQFGFLEIITARKSAFMTEIAFSSSFPVEGASILLVEDIIDTGVTQAYIMEQLQLYQPRSLRICSLLDKPYRRKVDLQADHLGFESPDRHVVGYGLDFQGQFANLPFLGYVD